MAEHVWLTELILVREYKKNGVEDDVSTHRSQMRQKGDDVDEKLIK
jgi:hypothetical protein